MILAQFLRRKGLQADHVFELGFAQENDSKLWQFACRHNYVAMSKDEDWLHHWTKQPDISLVWIRCGNCRNHFLLTTIENALPQIISQLEKKSQLIIVE